MREIKFRGKDLETKDFVFGSLIAYTPCPVIQSPELRENDYDYQSWEVDPDTVGQYTGLKDKNGVEIYEGDILKVDESRYDSRVKNRIYTTREVIYNDGGFIISQSAQRIYEYSRIEVIGNIHSNPELLK